MDNKTLQRSLKTLGYYDGPIDGIMGGKALDAVDKLLKSEIPADIVDKWSADRKVIAAKQITLREMNIEVGIIDGMMGPSTQHAIEVWQNMVRAVPGDEADHVPLAKIVWPTQAQVPGFYGPVGTSQVMLELPYKMKLAWDVSKPMTRFSCHTKVRDSLGRVFAAVLASYGETEIAKLRLDMFGGCLNVRKMRGGNSWSMHSWGIAVDMDPENNQLRMGRDKATFARPEYDPWWDAWEAEGWVSLGKARNYDWMHTQAARL